MARTKYNLILSFLLVLVINFVVGKLSRPFFEDVLSFDAVSKNDWDAPKFCHGLDCPKYKVLNTTDEYEVRSYKDTYKYMITTVEGKDYSKAVKEGFLRIFNYIDGKNEENQKIAMTAPVLVRVTPGAGPYCKEKFAIAFFVPYDLQDTTLPKAYDDRIKIITSPSDDRVYVRSFGGYADIKTILSEVKTLGEVLEKEGISYEKASFVTAGYDSPFKVFNRHNEVLLLGK